MWIRLTEEELNESLQPRPNANPILPLVGAGVLTGLWIIDDVYGLSKNSSTSSIYSLDDLLESIPSYSVPFIVVFVVLYTVQLFPRKQKLEDDGLMLNPETGETKLFKDIDEDERQRFESCKKFKWVDPS